LLLTVLALVVAGCSPAKHHTALTPASVRTAGCGRAYALGTSPVSFVVDGRARQMLVHVPVRYRGRAAVPVVFNLHADRSTPADQESLADMDLLADTNTFIVVYPEGGLPAFGAYDWVIPGEAYPAGSRPPGSLPDDVAFLRQAVSMMGERYCIDPGRVYLTGFAAGARMASALGCSAGDVFAAVAAVSGLRGPGPAADCSGGGAAPAAISVLGFHGTADPIDPLEGHGEPYWTYSVDAAAARWAAYDGCSPQPVMRGTTGGVTVVRYSRCARQSEVVLYLIRGEGHQWPGGATLPAPLDRTLGPRTDAVDANVVMWAFFVNHRLAGSAGSA
jgi:polyhydroxybutyrate depolymerase